MCFGIDGMSGFPQPGFFLLCQLDANLVSDRLSHLALPTQNITYIRFVASRPKCCSGEACSSCAVTRTLLPLPQSLAEREGFEPSIQVLARITV